MAYVRSPSHSHGPEIDDDGPRHLQPSPLTKWQAGPTGPLVLNLEVACPSELSDTMTAMLREIPTRPHGLHLGFVDHDVDVIAMSDGTHPCRLWPRNVSIHCLLAIGRKFGHTNTRTQTDNCFCSSDGAHAQCRCETGDGAGRVQFAPKLAPSSSTRADEALSPGQGAVPGPCRWSCGECGCIIARVAGRPGTVRQFVSTRCAVLSVGTLRATIALDSPWLVISGLIDATPPVTSCFCS